MKFTRNQRVSRFAAGILLQEVSTLVVHIQFQVYRIYHSRWYGESLTPKERAFLKKREEELKAMQSRLSFMAKRLRDTGTMP